MPRQIVSWLIAFGLGAVLWSCSEESTTTPPVDDPDPNPTDTLRAPDPGLSYVPECGITLPLANCLGGNLPPDAIQSILDPEFLSVSEVDFLLNNDRVFGIEIEGQFFAFPQRIMNVHEVVNFSVRNTEGDLVVRTSATWCPLTFSFIEWRADWDNPTRARSSSFGVSGALLDNNLVLYDRETNSTWSQILGVSLLGEKAGVCLEKGRNTVDTTWLVWKTMHPNSGVLTNEPNLPTPINPNVYNTNQYQGYWAGLLAPPEKITFEDTRKSLQEVVLAVHGENGVEVIRPLSAVGTAEVSGTEMVMFQHISSETVFVFENNFEGQVRSFVQVDDGDDGLPRFQDIQSETIWTMDGIAESGPLAGKRLAQVPSFRVFWFAIASLYPNIPFTNI